MSDSQWTVSFGPGGGEGIPFPPDPKPPTGYLPSDDEIRECWAMAEINPDGYLNEGLEVPDEAGKYAEFDRWLKQVRAEAWDEAHSDGCEYVIDAKCRQFHRNPYREEH